MCMIFYTLPVILGTISHNVPAVYDVFAARKRATMELSPVKEAVRPRRPLFGSIFVSGQPPLFG